MGRVRIKWHKLVDVHVGNDGMHVAKEHESQLLARGKAKDLLKDSGPCVEVLLKTSRAAAVPQTPAG